MCSSTWSAPGRRTAPSVCTSTLRMWPKTWRMPAVRWSRRTPWAPMPWSTSNTAWTLSSPTPRPRSRSSIAVPENRWPPSFRPPGLPPSVANWRRVWRPSLQNLCFALAILTGMRPTFWIWSGKPILLRRLPPWISLRPRWPSIQTAAVSAWWRSACTTTWTSRSWFTAGKF